jgi:hypothetical protein
MSMDATGMAGSRRRAELLGIPGFCRMLPDGAQTDTASATTASSPAPDAPASSAACANSSRHTTGRFSLPATPARATRRPTLNLPHRRPRPRSVPAVADACASSRLSPASLILTASQPNLPDSTRHDRRPDPHPYRRRSPANDIFRRSIPGRAKADPRARSRVSSRRRTAIRRRSARPGRGRRFRPRRKHAANTARRGSADRQIPIGGRLSQQRLTDPRFPPLEAFGRRPSSLHPASTPAPRPASETLHNCSRSPAEIHWRVETRAWTPIGKRRRAAIRGMGGACGHAGRGAAEAWQTSVARFGRRRFGSRIRLQGALAPVGHELIKLSAVFSEA